MSAFQKIYDYYMSKSSYGVVGLVIDAVILALMFACVIIFVYKKTKKKGYIFTLLGYLLLGIIAVYLELLFVKIAYLVLFPVIIVLMVVNGEAEGKHSRNYEPKSNKQFITDQDDKTKLINTLIKTAEYFSARQIGAIITIEKENNLNVYIQKAVLIDSVVTFELLETIFHPNTALHDGAVIIRGNRIMCASAFYTPSDKGDIPQHFGSRHRAAIGISEESDAFTIVVSEETGNIATTIGGTISSNVSLETLRLSLSQHIIVQ